jgi:hypothetical protein
VSQILPSVYTKYGPPVKYGVSYTLCIGLHFLDNLNFLILLLAAFWSTLVHSLHSQIHLHSHCFILREKRDRNRLLKIRDDDHCGYFGYDAVKSGKFLTILWRNLHLENLIFPRPRPPVVKICRIGLVTKMNSLYRTIQLFHIRYHTRVEPVVKRLFLIRKPRWKKS